MNYQFDPLLKSVLIDNTDLELLHRKAAAFDGIAKHELTIYYHSYASAHASELRYECVSTQPEGCFAATALEAAERMIAACEAREIANEKATAMAIGIALATNHKE